MNRAPGWLLRGSGALAAACILAACSGLHSRAPLPQTYLLKVTASPAADPGTGASDIAGAGSAAGAGVAAVTVNSIQIARPQARPGLDTERIAVLQPDRRADYYAGAQWAGALPDVVESLIIDRLRAAAHWPVVESSRSAFPAEYLLQVRIASFEAQTGPEHSAPKVIVTLQCSLGDRLDREVLSEFTVEASADAAANRMGAVVAAFESASGAALDQLETRAWKVVEARAAGPTGARKSPSR